MKWQECWTRKNPLGWWAAGEIIHRRSRNLSITRYLCSSGVADGEEQVSQREAKQALLFSAELY
jgi:hypothetical protein